MDLSTWQTRVRERLQASAATIRSLAPSTLYGFLAGSTLLPLVASVNQGDFAALVTLGSIASGVGGNLIANQVQAWKDRSDAELAAELGARAAENAEWRQAIDTVMEAVETPRIVQAILSEADRDWFVRTLRDELGRLGNLHRYDAHLVGSGAIVQGPGAVGAGQGGIAVSGNIHGPVTIHNAPPDPRAAEEARLLKRYLDRLRQECNVLPLAPLGGEEGMGGDVTLEQVYVALNTATRVPLAEGEKPRARLAELRGETDRPLTAMEAATQHRRLALLGDPGSGKSTFARQLVAWLAAARMGERAAPDGWEPDLLPMMITVRELKARLGGQALDGLSARKQREMLADAVVAQLEAVLDEYRCAGLHDMLAGHLADGRLLLVFDGLDEVASSIRVTVRAAVAALLATYPAIKRIFITSRTRSYTEDVAFSGFVQHQLAPFDEDQVRDFVAAWYNAQVVQGRIKRTDADARTANLQEAALGDDLRELSSNPMLLTTMAIVHQRETSLPRERVKLYSLAVGVLLERWQRAKGIDVSPALADILRDERKLRTIMERIAYDAHRQRRQEAADLQRGDLLTLLEDGALLGDPGLAGEFLDYVDQRAGLLLGRGGAGMHPQNYAFPHRTFQEYLAGCYLVSGRAVTRTYREHLAEGDFWYLAAMLGAEELLFNRRRPEAVLDLMYALCPVALPGDAAGWRGIVWSGQMATLLSNAEIEADDGHDDGGKAYLARLIPRLLGAMREGELTPIERVEAGRALGKLGDPRIEVLDPLRIKWCNVPAGPFLMGGKDDPQALDSEKPQHEVVIPYDFRISRFTVTNAQYQRFVDGGGYAEERYWAEARAAGVWQDGQVENRGGPVDYGEPFTLANHPVVGVTWYEALAFTRWLTDALREQGQLPAGWQVGLPSEAEWEKAARGVDGRIYPWGEGLTPQHANYADTGIGTTSAVGCFPMGAGPYETEEMAGNVWEWTRSQWGTNFSSPEYGYPYDPADGRETLDVGQDTLRVLRGGSFNLVGSVRCAARYWNFPNLQYWSYGFRVVLSPFFSGR